MVQHGYTINRNDLYLTVKLINRIPDAYDNRLNGYYKNLTDREEKILKDRVRIVKGGQENDL